MLLAGLLASVELGLNRVLRLDSTALPRLAHLSGKVIAVDCRSPAACFWLAASALEPRPPGSLTDVAKLVEDHG